MLPDGRVPLCAFLCLLSFRLLAMVQVAKGDTPTREEIEQAWRARYCQLIALPSPERISDLTTTYGSFHGEYGFSTTGTVLSGKSRYVQPYVYRVNTVRVCLLLSVMVSTCQQRSHHVLFVTFILCARRNLYVSLFVLRSGNLEVLPLLWQLPHKQTLQEEVTS